MNDTGFVPSVWHTEDDVLQDILICSEYNSDTSDYENAPMPETLVNYYQRADKSVNKVLREQLSRKEDSNQDTEKDIDERSQQTEKKLMLQFGLKPKSDHKSNGQPTMKERHDRALLKTHTNGKYSIKILPAGAQFH